MSETSGSGLSVDLSGQVAIVTGASQGLGKAMALALGATGCRVACVARNVEKLADTVGAIESCGGSAGAFACDVKDRDRSIKLSTKSPTNGRGWTFWSTTPESRAIP